MCRTCLRKCENPIIVIRYNDVIWEFCSIYCYNFI